MGRAFLVASVFLLIPPSGGAQSSDVPFLPDTDPSLARADSLFLAGDARAALAQVEVLLDEDPESYELLWRAASLAVAVEAVREEVDARGEARAWYEQALEWAESAVRVRPDGVQGRYWGLAALGRTALSAGRREASEIGNRMRARALALLDDHPGHAGAHHALGRLYYEIMSVSGVVRFFGRAFIRGDALGEASWELAEHHLRTAVAAEPQMAMYQLDLGRLLLARGDAAEAREALERAVEVAETHPPDRIFAREARRLLNDSGACRIPCPVGSFRDPLLDPLRASPGASPPAPSSPDRRPSTCLPPTYASR